MLTNTTLKYNTELQLNLIDLKKLLKILGDLLPNSLSLRVDLDLYAKKLIADADIEYAINEGNVVGILALYANDLTAKHAHIAILSILMSIKVRV